MTFATYIHGIDLSKWQEGPNDFRALRNGGYDFAVTRWGVGTYRDPTRISNLRAIADAGIIPGAYFVPGEKQGSGITQADQFINEVRHSFPSLPILWTMDAETSQSYGNPTAQQCADFCARIRARTGCMVMGYVPKWWMNQQGWTTAQVQAVAANALWWQSRYTSSPNFASPPDAAGYRGWELAFWQHSSTGQAPGIPGNCDLDVFYGTRAQLAALTGSTEDEEVLTDEQEAQLALLPEVMERIRSMHMNNWQAIGGAWGSLDWLGKALDDRFGPLNERITAIEQTQADILERLDAIDGGAPPVTSLPTGGEFILTYSDTPSVATPQDAPTE
jgi:lysozyme